MATPIPPNRAAFTVEEVARATGASVTSVPRDASPIVGVSTDSRGDVRGTLFVALRGESFDGHRFIDAAVRGGASAVLSEDPLDVGPATLFRVTSTLAALGDLARAHRRRWGGRLVAVAGSAGKTTTRASIAALLLAASPGKVHFVPGNLNNLVGVPMVLFGLGADHEHAVVEIGTNAVGEVPRLVAVTEPDCAVLTLVGLEHTAGLGDLDTIEREEGAVLAGLEPEGAAFGNADDPRVVRQLGASPAATRTTYGTAKEADYRIVAREPLGLAGTRVSIARPDGSTVRIAAPLFGAPGALAVAAALAVVEHAVGREISEDEATLALRNAAEPGRLRPVELADGTVLLDDSYNSNPPSARASLQAAREFADHRGARLVVVLGEMRELGHASRSEHRALGGVVEAARAAVVVTVGGDAVEIAGRAVRFAPDVAAAVPLVRDHTLPGDVVLIKGSRGVGLERIVEALVRDRGRPA